MHQGRWFYSLFCRMVMAFADVLISRQIPVMQKTLDELIDRGDISSRDLDTRTMDALEGRQPLECLLPGPIPLLQ